VRIEQLEYVAAVARLGSFRRAADAVHVSQPSISESVRALERELGVDILERGRSGAKVSESGREILQHILTVLDAVDGLRDAATEQHQSRRVVRLGTVSTATAPLLAPVIRQFRDTHETTQVEIIGGLHADVQRMLLEGSVDLGLANYLEGDDLPPEVETTTLLIGRPVVCMRPDNPLAAEPVVPVTQLRAAPLIVMHRFVHRLLREDLPAFACLADGAEQGKLLVAEGVGVTVLPDFSVAGDPLETRGVITTRPLADDTTRVLLVLERLRSGSSPQPARDLHRMFVQRARAYRDAA
jgi:DNA-binding transcriptional LysR family regulator